MTAEKSTFTPGPWKIVPLGDRFLRIMNDEGDDAVTVCLTDYAGKETNDGWSRDLYVPRPNAVADANLIAAAPDLLAACETVMRAIHWRQPHERMTQKEQEAVLYNAIAKAT